MSTELDLDTKIALLMSLAATDHEGASGRDPSMPLPPRLRHASEVGALRPLNLRTVRSSGPSGQQKTLLRILMTNACSFNCHYCPMRRDREMPRTLLKPEELVRIFLAARRRGWCEGLFITTGMMAAAQPRLRVPTSYSGETSQTQFRNVVRRRSRMAPRQRRSRASLLWRHASRSISRRRAART